MKHGIKRMVLCIIAMVLLICTSVTSTAATGVCKPLQGNTGAARTFIVKTTKNKGKMTFTPKKGIIKRENKFTHKKSTKSNYGFYKITIEDMKTGKTRWLTMYDDSRKITLTENSTYRITVSPMNQNLFSQLSFCNLWFFTGWKTNATWSVTKISNIITNG